MHLPEVVHPCAAILVAVGPGMVELDRLSDLGASISRYAPEIRRFLLIDDARRPEALLAALPRELRPAVRITANPRHRNKLGWREGLNVGIWNGLRSLAEECSWDFVFKLDTDSLLIAPPLQAIARILHDAPRAGLIGTYRTSPAGVDTGWRIFGPWIELLRSRLLLYRDPVTKRRHLRIGIGPRANRQRALLEAALNHGYEPGEHCQGGGYALAGHALAALARTGVLDDIHLWSNVPLTEDVALALCVRALGLDLAAANGLSQPFGVQYAGLAFPPETLLARGHSIIHSLKNDRDRTEGDIRAFYASIRAARTPASR